jgi:hypothetical protein
VAVEEALQDTSRSTPEQRSRRRVAWTAGLLQGLLSGTVSTIVISPGAPRTLKDRLL